MGNINGDNLIREGKPATDIRTLPVICPECAGLSMLMLEFNDAKTETHMSEHGRMTETSVCHIGEGRCACGKNLTACLTVASDNYPDCPECGGCGCEEEEDDE